MVKLTEAQIQVLCRADETGNIIGADIETCPGIHFCPDWDYLPVCDASPEKEGCTCDLGRGALASTDGRGE